MGQAQVLNGPASVGFDLGTCPRVVGFTAPQPNTFTLLVDFGAGCELFGLPGYSCSRNTSGSLDRNTKLMMLGFNYLNCGANLTSNPDVITGVVVLGYVVNQSVVSLDGAVNVVLNRAGSSVTAAGNVTTTFDRGSVETRMASFNGSIMENNDTYGAAMSGIAVSYPGDSRLTPFIGTIDVASPAIRNLSIRFKADSPSTGEIEVSIAGSAFFIYTP